MTEKYLEQSPVLDKLSKEQIQTFIEDGVLVVDNFLSEEQLKAAKEGLSQTLAQHGVETDDLPATGQALTNLSSTNGSGGVLDLFYDDWKMKIATDARLFHITTQLWKKAYCHDGETKDQLTDNCTFKWHPYGAFNIEQGYSYIDRIGFRIPTVLAEQLGAMSAFAATSTKKKKKTPIQRSLTPHLDCCPDALFDNDRKWRPIQCFVSLTSNEEPNTGGFEAVKGFHREFDHWAENRTPSIVTRKTKGGSTETVTFPAPCIGEYTHIRPLEDRLVMERVEHVPVRAGSVVFWDNRIPHANAYRHDGKLPRCVVYCSFLPYVPINREYAAKQLENWKHGRQPTDQWINTSDESCSDSALSYKEQINALDPLSSRLLGIDPW